MTNEKRLQFDLDKTAGKYESLYIGTAHERIAARNGYKAGFNKGAELERERILDLVMEWAEKSKFGANDEYDVFNAVDFNDLKAIISKLKGK